MKPFFNNLESNSQDFRSRSIFQSIYIHFKNREDKNKFSQVIQQIDDSGIYIENKTGLVSSCKFNYQVEGKKKSLIDTKSLEEWRSHWQGMPEFYHQDLTPQFTILAYFESKEARDRFSKIVEQNITNKTKSIWYPEAEITTCMDKRYISDNPKNPKYPVYIISKGRWENRLTSKSLENIGVPYYIVVEPQEYEKYAARIDSNKILTLPFSNLGQGSIPARNWVWEHALDSGYKRHWIIDDNINGFFRFNRNLKVPVGDGTIFRAAEDFTDRYSNIKISGFNYFMFASRKTLMPAFYLNTRIYSCILIDNSLEFRWRGRYNEDTDLCIRALKAGYCTVLFNAFLALKTTTMSMKGGNTDELYKETDNRWEFAKSLKDQHPDIVKITKKWGRWHHHVDYSVFRQRLKKKRNTRIPKGIDNYQMRFTKIDK